MKNKIFIKNYNYKNRNFFGISMIPYPSGYLHIGHIRNYSINDIFNRFLNLKKYNIYKYIGWDCFGTPAENISIEKKIIPFDWIVNNIIYMKKQFNYVGFFKDWNNYFITCNKKYYKISQWIFIKLLKNNLIYFNKKKINWDPFEKTVLSNEQVINGLGWRSGVKIKFLKKKTYFINLIKYKNELFNEIKNLNWPLKVKIMQLNWLGKEKKNYFKLFFSKLFNFKNFSIKKINEIFNIIFIFLIKKIFYFSFKFKKNKEVLINNLLFFLKKNNKLFINTSLFFLNLKNLKKIELWKINKNIKNYNFILISYLKFKFFDLKKNLNYSYKEHIFYLKKKFINLFKKKINWKIKDWGVSRQRYWGTPIPIIICNKCGYLCSKIYNFVLPKKLNPCKSNNILNKNIYFKNTICYKCKKLSIKENETLDTFFDSSWYFLNYLNFKKKNTIVNKWFPIDFYSGGIEHSILHLLYSRFIIKFLRDIKYLNFGEPIKYLFTQGMILNKTYYNKNNGIINWLSKDNLNSNYFEGKIEKMSKSKKNGINPYNLIKIYGVDSLRLSIIYSSSLNKDFIWKNKYIISCYKILKKFWFFYKKNKSFIIKNIFYKKDKININNKLFLNFFYKKLKDINFFYLNIKYEKIVSVFFILLNKIKKIKFNLFVLNEIFSSIIRLLNPIIPHITYKLWNNLSYNKDLGNILYTFWPKIYLIKLKKIRKYLILLNNKKINLLIIKNKKFFIKKIINYIFFKKNIKKKFLIKIILNKNIINIIYNNK
ncbi:Leucyl-tRNA synthetase [Candidatus Nasuia deltocephalinicola]|nr:Leucyl-tRNA synthetase [Candidatus Nasuia deltocephalinicola]